MGLTFFNSSVYILRACFEHDITACVNLLPYPILHPLATSLTLLNLVSYFSDASVRLRLTTHKDTQRIKMFKTGICRQVNYGAIFLNWFCQHAFTHEDECCWIRAHFFYFGFL